MAVNEFAKESEEDYVIIYPWGLMTMRKRQKNIDATNKVEAARLKEETCRRQYRTETG